MRLIDAESLVKHIEDKVDMQDVYSPLHIIQFIHREPTISPCVGMECVYEDQCPNIPHGKWIKGNAYYDERANSMFDKCKCSICGITQSFYEDNETGELYSFNFCPNCGASMKKGGAE